ncbi:MAG: hypothetical protein P8I94_06960 [Emcibacteraceae bacterium]|nr:hypothetical protein [Emcibacteraceae bacterium]
MARRKAAFENLDTSNVYSNMENTMEDLTVNTQAADFQAQQQQQGLSNTLNSLQGAAGGSGIAALAQSLANQQANNLQSASASIGQQERSNQMAAAQQASNIQSMEAQGELISRNAENEKVSTLLGMSQQRLGAANAARAKATDQLVGGIGDLAGAGVDFLTAGGGSALEKLAGK